jgi:photosystem II stability/assembly factor-like uncharacterized protein
VEGGCQQLLLRTHDGGAAWSREDAQLTSQGGAQEYLFIDPSHGWRVDVFGGGMTDAYWQTIEGYVGNQPVVMPEVGEGHESRILASTILALSFIGVLLVGAGSVSQCRRRRSC